ncbi:hypothetical protein [Streptomyces viridochromogenes]|uniref:hypothetical protein n=1 Tax=Streptomyces viridochromogenes TaxID=1938 RepID=UPI00069F755C|nr:hypothetical protein [Streptomyces viridochromogenes]KOG25051.1 hypothetical protein ADK36_06860 [Streptomyces viridochromogenes]KOG26518.1 hypothetical protein ADK35_07550 [Streptomyces viridochromogenes]
MPDQQPQLGGGLVGSDAPQQAVADAGLCGDDPGIRVVVDPAGQQRPAAVIAGREPVELGMSEPATAPAVALPSRRAVLKL